MLPILNLTPLFELFKLPRLKCSHLRSFSSDTCQEESSEWRAQKNERLFIGKKLSRDWLEKDQ